MDASEMLATVRQLKVVPKVVAPLKEVKKPEAKPVKVAKKSKAKTKVKKRKVLPRIKGPAVHALKFKEGKRHQGQCDIVGCMSKSRTPRAFRCAKHQLDVRTAQLKANNVTWQKRVKAGTAGHRRVYHGEPTTWADAQAAKKRKKKG